MEGVELTLTLENDRFRLHVIKVLEIIDTYLALLFELDEGICTSEPSLPLQLDDCFIENVGASSDDSDDFRTSLLRK